MSGLQITGGDSIVRGLAINYFNIGISLETAGNNVIAGNYIGLALDGVTPVGNRTGIRITSTSDGNRIGTDGDGLDDTAERNVISASGFVQQNNSFGILIDSGSDQNLIAGNHIGADASGTLDRGNAQGGIVTGGITVIGTNGDGVGDAVEGNLISGNDGHGISLSTTASGSRVSGNKIGTEISGTSALANNSHGVSVGPCSGSVQCSNHIIGTDGDGISDALEGNLISGNGGDGVFIPAGTLNNNVVAGNKIGTNLSGTAALPNDVGVSLGGTSSRVGTNHDGISDNLEGNLIAGNGQHGVYIPNASQQTIAGNKIGTNVDGAAALPNVQSGIRVEGNNIVIRDNLVSGNNQHGIHIYDAFFITVTGNTIGAALDGVTPLGNSLHGVLIATNSDDSTIGGGGAGEANVIAFNSGDGVFVDSSCGAGLCLHNTILGNSIFENGELGIDLAPNGVTPNDAGDGDTGANNLQNYPLVSAASALGANIVVTGTLNSTPATTFTLNFYSSPTCDPSGNGEGAVYLGTGLVATDGNGDAAFVLSLAGFAADGDALSGTATSPDGNTSEFSSCGAVVGEEPISGLQAANDGPTPLGLPTHFTSTLQSGTGVSFAWDFGDGSSATGAFPSHTYTATGSYSATVTVSNSLGSATAGTNVTILPPLSCAATADDGATVFSSQDASALQQAVDGAVPGGVVKIAGSCAGVTTRDGRTQTVFIDKALTLSGGYHVSDWGNPQQQPTLLDAQSLGRVLYIHNAAPVILEKLIIQNGLISGSAADCPDYGGGGGIYTDGSLVYCGLSRHHPDRDDFDLQQRGQPGRRHLPLGS